MPRRRRFRPRRPRARPSRRGRRFVDSGKIVTTAGVSAGIDGALHVVARLVGRWAADETARYMEYHWSPEPYLARSYSYLDPGLDETGRSIQQALILEGEGDSGRPAAAWREIAAAGDPRGWYRLGRLLHGEGRYDEAIDAARRAAADAAIPPELRRRALYNIACARALQGQPAEALDALERAIDAGFASKHSLEGDPDLKSIRGEARFRALLARL